MQQLKKRLLKVNKKIIIDPKQLKIRSKVELAYTQENSKISAYISVNQKSRILMKDCEKFDEILDKMVRFCGHTFTHKYLIIHAPLCSKALKLLTSKGWIVEHTAL